MCPRQKRLEIVFVAPNNEILMLRSIGVAMA
jgi:hypothetical protein